MTFTCDECGLDLPDNVQIWVGANSFCVRCYEKHFPEYQMDDATEVYHDRHG